MKKLLLTTLAIFLSLSLFGRPRELNPKVIDKAITDWVLEGLRELGYTVLPEVIVQDTLNHKKQRFSSRFETKGGRGYLLPDWANDSTWTPGSRPPQEKSNYEKYWESKNGSLEKPRHEPKPEFDDLYYQPSKDGKRMKHQKNDTIKKDTVQVNTIMKDPVAINNYYIDNDFYYANRINRFHSDFWFDYYSPFHSPYYGWYSPYYYDSWYWGYNSWYGWNFSFGWGYPYYGWYSPYRYGWHTPYYIHNDYNYYGYNQPKYNNVQYGRRERPSNMSNTYNRRIAEAQPQRNRIEAPQQRINPQDKPTYQQNRRTYTPSYETPRMGTRPNYNNSKTNEMGRTYERRTEISTESRTQTRTITQPNIQRSTQSRTYSAPIQNRSSNYSAPSRSYSQPTPSRSSNYNSSPSMDRRSSGSNFNSGGSSSGVSRSSGSSTGSSGSSSSSHSSGGRR
jgi:hypothetical protein